MKKLEIILISIIIAVISISSIQIYVLENTLTIKNIQIYVLKDALAAKTQEYEWLSEFTNEIVYGDADKEEIKEFIKMRSIDPQT